MQLQRNGNALTMDAAYQNINVGVVFGLESTYNENFINYDVTLLNNSEHNKYESKCMFWVKTLQSKRLNLNEADEFGMVFRNLKTGKVIPRTFSSSTTELFHCRTFGSLLFQLVGLSIMLLGCQKKSRHDQS